MLSRRGFLGGMAAALAAPYVIRDSGLLMPVRDRLILPSRGLDPVLGIVLEWGETAPSHWRIAWAENTEKLSIADREQLARFM